MFIFLFNQQHPDFFFSSAEELLVVNLEAPPWGKLGFGVFSFWRFAFTDFAIAQKASDTLVPAFAEVSKNGIPNYFANASPSSLLTTRFATSILFP